jgi:hypothetical protein
VDVLVEVERGENEHTHVLGVGGAAGAVLAGYAVAMLVVASRTTIRPDIG